MAIDANVAYVECREDGSGTLHLCDRIPNGSRGQSRLRFETAPFEVTALNGLPIWAGGSGPVKLGDATIGTRVGYSGISFTERELFFAAVAAYHARQRAIEDTCR